jgi:hypothetical protein
MVREDDPPEGIHFREMLLATHAIHDLEGLLAVDLHVSKVEIVGVCPAIRAFPLLDSVSDQGHVHSVAPIFWMSEWLLSLMIII